MAGLVYTGILQSARRRKARTRPEPTIRWGRQLCWNRCTRVQPPADRDAPPPGMLLGCFLCTPRCTTTGHAFGMLPNK